MESSSKSPALTMRVLKYAMVVSAFLFIYVAVTVPVQPGPPPSPQFEISITLVALACVAGGFVVPRMFFQARNLTPQENLAQADVQRWFSKGVLSLALFEACILFGLVLHFVHARIWLIEFLFGLGIVAELVWSPGAPPGAGNGEFPAD